MREIQVAELFYSIQGESTWAGLPCCFIRLAGCNLRCSYCDARYSYEEPATALAVPAILHWLTTYPGVLVEITGGEPLLQDAVYPLLEQLAEAGRTVLLETNGSISLEKVPDTVRIICDIKCPDSGSHAPEHRQQWLQLLDRKQRGCRDNGKFVLSSEEDFFWALRFLAQWEPAAWPPVLFSPVRDRLTPDRLAALILAHQVPVRLQLQLHTLLWPQEKRGV